MASKRKQDKRQIRRNHKLWPLGTPVIVQTIDGTELRGRVNRHVRGKTNSCDVVFLDADGTHRDVRGYSIKGVSVGYVGWFVRGIYFNHMRRA